MVFYTIIFVIAVVIAIWVAWRLCSRRALLPCPAALSCLVEMDNPLARVTHSKSVIRQLGLKTGARVADIGCGPGRVTIPLARAVGSEGEVIAMDVQAEMLAKIAVKAEKHQLSNIRLLRCDARERKLPENSLDAAVMVMALGEIPDNPEVLSMIYSVLKAGGHLLIAESVFDPHFIGKKRLIDII